MHLFHILAIAAHLQNLLEEYGAEDFERIELSEQELDYMSKTYVEVVPREIQYTAVTSDDIPAYTPVEKEYVEMFQYVYAAKFYKMFMGERFYFGIVHRLLIGIGQRSRRIRYRTYITERTFGF